MWRLDPYGTPLDDADSAREELRRRAWLAISDGLRCGRDLRHHRVRLRDEFGGVLFEGTLAEAIASDTEGLVLPAPQPEETVADASKRIIQEIRLNRQSMLRAIGAFSKVVSSFEIEAKITSQLLASIRTSTY